MENHQDILDRLDQASEHFREHEDSDRRNFDAINATLTRIENTLKPISETYDTASTLWRWVMALAVLVSIVVGIVVGIMKIGGK